MSEYQNIVIVGGSIAGHALVNALAPILPATHRIIVIDASEFAYWPVAALRAAVVPGWEDKITAPISTATFFKAGTPHQVLAPNKVLELKANSVVVEKPFEGSTEIPFFKCVIATGSQQPSPMRPYSASLEETKESLRKQQKDVEAAKKIVVIGAGPVGLEWAGEIRDRYPDKEITIIHNRSSVLSPSGTIPPTKPESYVAPSSTPKLSVQLEKELAIMNISLLLEDRAEPSKQPGEWDGSFGPQNGEVKVTLKSGKDLKADYVFVSIGNKASSGLVGTADAGAIADGMVLVDEFLRVKSKNEGSVLKDYYSIGDVCTTPGWKTSQGATSDGGFVATNIVNDIKQKPLKKYTRSVVHALFIPLGQNHGAGSLTLPMLGTISAPLFMIKAGKSKKLLINEAFLSMYQGAEKVPSPVF